MKFSTMVDDVWKKVLSVDLDDMIRFAALQALKRKSMSVLPWAIGAAAVGFGAGMFLGPKIVAQGKHLTAVAGETLSRIGSEIKAKAPTAKA